MTVIAGETRRCRGDDDPVGLDERDFWVRLV
jgi:hypothetical protein